MKRKILLSLALILAPALALAQNATVSANPPSYATTGSQALSQTRTGGLRVQQQDGAGNDVSASHPAPVTCVSGCTGGGSSSTAINDGTTTTQKAAVDTSGGLKTNLGEIAGTAPDVNSGNKSAGTQRVVLATDQPALTNALLVFQGCGTASAANTLVKPINNAGGASNLLLVTGVSNQKVHICGINIGPVASAVNVALVEGTTTTNACDTGTAGMAGGATAATGWQLAANGGLTYGNGSGLVAQSATNADNVCLLFSGGVQVSGVITYAVY